MDIELCVGSFEEALLAQQFKLKRIELCSSLELGGLTPSLGLIRQCAQIPDIETHVMIRPRAGDFVYSESEIGIMVSDIRAAAESGALGVVFGALTNENQLDLTSLSDLTKEARANGLEITFHRAFDLTSDPINAMKSLIELQFDRILTSGQKPNAVEGIDLIRKLSEHSKGLIQLMAGSGVNAENVKLLSRSGVDAIHFTARKIVPSINDMDMGDRYEPDPKKVVSILAKLQRSE